MDKKQAKATAKQIKEMVEQLKKMKKLAKLAEKLVKQVVGMDEKSAVKLIEDAELRARILSRDEKYFNVTMDYRADRINLNIKDGKVVSATIG